MELCHVGTFTFSNVLKYLGGFMVLATGTLIEDIADNVCRLYNFLPIYHERPLLELCPRLACVFCLL